MTPHKRNCLRSIGLQCDCFIADRPAGATEDKKKALRRRIVALMAERALNTARSKASEWHRLNREIVRLQREHDRAAP